MDAGQPRGAPQHPRGLILGGVLGAAIAAAGVVWGAALPEWMWWHVAGALLVGGAGGWLAVFDLATHRLPNRVTYPTAAALAALIGAGGFAGVGGGMSALGWGLGLGFVFLLLALIAGGGFGLGDVKLSVILGAWTGWLAPGSPLVFVLASFVRGGVVALGLMAARRATASTHIAFGPVLVAGALAATWWAGA